MPTLGPVASTFLVVFYVLSALILVGVLVAVTILLYKLNALLEEVRQKADPLLNKLDTVLTLTTEKVNTIGDKAETILSQGEELTEMVHERVDRTTHAVQTTVFTPLIGLNSLLAGVRRGLETFTTRQQDTLTQTVTSPPPIAANAIQPVVGDSTASSSENKNIANSDAEPAVYTVVSNEAGPIMVGSRKE